jgi:hypothetical protein
LLTRGIPFFGVLVTQEALSIWTDLITDDITINIQINSASMDGGAIGGAMGNPVKIPMVGFVKSVFLCSF